MAGYTGSIPITGFIAPTDNQDTYPVIDPIFGIDGLRNVPTEADMYVIPAGRRRVGMVVGCVSSGNYYKLLSPPWSYNSSDWANFLSIPAPGNIPRTQYYITGGSVSVSQYYQYLVYGNMTIGASGSLINDGQVVIINGTLSFVSNGTYSGSGTITYLTDFSRVNSIQPFNYTTYGVGPNLSQPNVKYSASFSSSASVPITITHSLNTMDINYSVRENNNFITVNVEINDVNSVKVTTDANITNGRINIIG
jgi:hypothetical protein